MKKIILTWAGLACFTAMLFTGCTSSGKVDDARDKVEAAKENVTEAKEKVMDAQQHLGNELNHSRQMHRQKLRPTTTALANCEKKSKNRAQWAMLRPKKRLPLWNCRTRPWKHALRCTTKTTAIGKKFKQEFSNDLEGLGQALKNFTVNKQ
jgi:hypothetical protein